MADDLLLKTGDKRTAAQRQVGALTLGVAAVKLDAVHGAHIVDVDGVAVLGRTVGDLLGGGKVRKEVLLNKSGHVLIAHFAQGGVDGDIGVVVGQRDVVGGGDVFQVAVFIKPGRVVEIRQVLIGGLIHGGLGGGGLSRGGGVGAFGGALHLGGAAAAGQRGGHAHGQQSGRGAVQAFVFHGSLLGFYKIAYAFTIIHAF